MMFSVSILVVRFVMKEGAFREKNIILWFFSLLYFIIYFKILGFIWGWVPFNTGTNLIAIFVTLFFNIPLSVISAEKTIRIIKSS